MNKVKWYVANETYVGNVGSSATAVGTGTGSFCSWDGIVSNGATGKGSSYGIGTLLACELRK